VKRICILLFCLLLYAAPALANSWGLTGELYQLVSATDEWNDYTTHVKQAGNIAMMENRYHHVLMIANGGTLQTSTKAVYQPGESKRPKLTANETGFSLRYSDGEWYSFLREDGAYRLHSARAGDVTVTATDNAWRYQVQDIHGTTAILTRRILLEDFNIRLFPRTINEVRHLNLMRASLDSQSACWEPGETLVENAGKGTAPVYSAPFGQSAWRAAKGKAAVGLSGRLWKLFPFRNQDGEEYWCIRYNVSPRTQRIGFVERAALDGKDAGPWTESCSLLSAGVVVIQETALTDDPDVSQYPQVRLPVGTQLTCMGLYDDDYAYVSAEVTDGRIADGGQIIWGFVPLRDVEMLSAWGTKPETALMEQMAGTWRFSAGGIEVTDVLTLHADGTWEGFTIQPESGVWHVRRYNPASGLYWNNPVYEAVFVGSDATAQVEGLTFEGDSFSLTNWEGGGGYQRTDGDAESEGNG